MSDVVFCPYNKNHRVVRSKLLNHMNKCNAPQEIKDRFASCKHNYLHIVEKIIQKRHEDIDCPDRPKEIIIREDDYGQEGWRDEAFRQWQIKEKKRQQKMIQQQEDNLGYKPIQDLSQSTISIMNMSYNKNNRQQYTDQSSHCQRQTQDINQNKKLTYAKSEQSYHKNRQDDDSDDSEEVQEDSGNIFYSKDSENSNIYDQDESPELSFLQVTKCPFKQPIWQDKSQLHNDTISSINSDADHIQEIQKNLNYPQKNNHNHKNQLNQQNNHGNIKVQSMYQAKEQNEYDQRYQIKEQDNYRRQQYQPQYENNHRKSNNFLNSNYQNDHENEGYYRNNYKQNEMNNYNQQNNHKNQSGLINDRDVGKYNRYLSDQYVNNNNSQRNQYQNNNRQQQQYQQEFNPNSSSSRRNTHSYNQSKDQDYYENDDYYDDNYHQNQDHISKQRQFYKYTQEQQDISFKPKQIDLYQSESKYRQRFIKPHNLPECERDNIEYLQLQRDLLFQDSLLNSEVRGYRSTIKESYDNKDTRYHERRNFSPKNKIKFQNNFISHNNNRNEHYEEKQTEKINRFNKRQKDNNYP